MKERDAEYRLSESSFEERNSKSSKEGSPINEVCQDIHSSIHTEYILLASDNMRPPTHKNTN